MFNVVFYFSDVPLPSMSDVAGHLILLCDFRIVIILFKLKCKVPWIKDIQWKAWSYEGFKINAPTIYLRLTLKFSQKKKNLKLTNLLYTANWIRSKSTHCRKLWCTSNFCLKLSTWTLALNYWKKLFYFRRYVGSSSL